MDLPGLCFGGPTLVMLVGTRTRLNHFAWLWLLWLPVVTHGSVNMNYFNCYLRVQISSSAVVYCRGTEKLDCHEMVDEKWWIICRLSNLCWSQMSPGEPPSLLTGCICTHNMSGNAAALFSSQFIHALILRSYICCLLSLRTLTPHYTSAAFIWREKAQQIHAV